MSIDHDIVPTVQLRSGVYTNEGLEDLHPNLILIADYLAGELPEADERAFEDRLDRDDDFRNMAEPLLVLEIAKRAQRGSAPDLESGGRASVGARLLRLWRTAVAGVVLVMIPVLLWVLTPDAARQQQLAREAVEQRASTESFSRPQVADSIGTVAVAPGVNVTPERGARLTVERLSMPWRTPRIALDGAAQVNILRGAHLIVVTAHGTSDLEAGRYVVRSEPNGGAFRIDGATPLPAVHP